MKKILLIVNPHAGVMKAKKFLADIISCFTSHGYITSVLMTMKKGDATFYAKEYSHGFEIVACIGGDGTLNEVVDGLMHSENHPLVGYIPAGSTNDFANCLKLSSNLTDAAEDIMSGTEHIYDVGKINDRYFTYVASFGAFTHTSYATSQNIKNALGHLAYILSGISDIPSIRPQHVKIVTDDDIVCEGDYIFGGICNSTSVGGILTLDSTEIDMNDGIFEVMLIKSPKDILELQEILSAIQSRRYESCRLIDFIKASDLTVFCPDDMDWSIDGEFFKGSEQIKIQNIRSGLSLLLRDKI